MLRFEPVSHGWKANVPRAHIFGHVPIYLFVIKTPQRQTEIYRERKPFLVISYQLPPHKNRHYVKVKNKKERIKKIKK